MILVISRVRAARFLLPRHLFSENVTHGVTFLKKKSSGGVTFQEKWGGRTSQNIKEYATFL